MWAEKIESADEKGDTRAIYREVKALGGSTANSNVSPTEKIFQTKNSNGTETISSERTSGPQELAEIWREFLEKKFSTTEVEKLRDEFERSPEAQDPEAELKRTEFEEAVKHLKNGKATEQVSKSIK